MTWYDGEDQLMTMTGTSTNDGTQKIRERGLSAVQIDTQKKSIEHRKDPRIRVSQRKN